MNRIAFRIYDPVEKGFVFSGSTPSMLERFFKVTAHLNCMYNMPYELFSGLQDIDGVDLYESDIVHAQDWNPQAYLIEYIEGGFCATYKDQFIPIDINMFYDSLGCHFKITGNAHER